MVLYIIQLIVLNYFYSNNYRNQVRVRMKMKNDQQGMTTHQLETKQEEDKRRRERTKYCGLIIELLKAQKKLVVILMQNQLFSSRNYREQHKRPSVGWKTRKGRKNGDMIPIPSIIQAYRRKLPDSNYKKSIGRKRNSLMWFFSLTRLCSFFFYGHQYYVIK